MLFAVVLSSCGNNVQVSRYYLDDDGNLIVVYDDNSEKDLGKWNEDIILSLKNITISDDGYFEIDGIKTSIFATNTYTVNFETGFSTKINSVKVKEGYKVDKPNISRTGYVLNGWKCNGEEWRFNSDIVKNDMILTADWTAKSYSIFFDEDGGTEVDDMDIIYDSSYVLPTTSKELYSFEGWQLNNRIISKEGKWQYDIDNSITLRAKWNRITHNVIFDSNGGGAINNLIVNSYTSIASLPTPEWTDHKFMGWKLNDSIVELPLQMNDEDINLVASWKGINEEFEFRDENDNTITITKYIGDDSIVNIPKKISNKIVKTIAEDAFNGCSNIEEIVLPSTLTNLEFKSLYGCANLKSLTISGDVNGSLKYFYGNNEDNVPLSLKTITFAEGSTSYSKAIFDGLSASHLFKINLPSSLKTTPSDAFFNCFNIEEVFVPEGITTLSSRTLCGCLNLKKVNIPSTCTSLGINVFANIHNVRYIIVPQSVKSFEYSCLANDAVILFERTEKVNSSAFAIYEDGMDIFYGFEQLKSNDTYIYALCKVGSIKQAVIISLVEGATQPSTTPDTLDNYPVVLDRTSM